jgi:DNA-binding GntR family transcriptional regulator
LKARRAPTTERALGGARPPPAEALPDGSADGRVSSSDQLAEEIVRGLYHGRYAPGQKLTEAELVQRYGVGRGTVRDALRRLATDGLVTLSLHRGASIRSFSRQDAHSAYEVLECVAGLAAKLAAERIDPKRDAPVLRELMGSLRTLAEAGDTFEFARLRDRFYRVLMEIGRNRELARLVPLIGGQLLRIQFREAYTAGAERKRLEIYEGVIDAVLAGDAARAERAMRRHIGEIAAHVDSLPDYFFA